MSSKQPQPRYELLPTGEFVIENYNQAPPFASFLPGVAGLKGIPLWAFYVNRGQGIASFGTRDKDHAILEFYPANKAYQLTSLHGFRTFIKAPKKNLNYEPFQNSQINLQSGIAQEMRVTSYDLSLKETNRSVGLETSVKYFTFPNEPFAALARILQIKNISKEMQELEILDGLPQIIPYGMNNWLLKQMSRTAEAWVGMTNLDKTGVPYYKLKVEIKDTPEVTPIHEGHFYLHYLGQSKKGKVSKVVVDPTLAFGQVTDFTWPEIFFSDGAFVVPASQTIDNKTPCALGYNRLRLKPGQTTSLYTLIGQIRGENRLNAQLSRLLQPNTFAQKEKENRELIQGIQSNMETRSALPAFDHYCKQSYLDNVLRGGLPHPIPTEKEPFVFHVYWRKHGDLERDYNHFEVMPTYYAQGNANYRDINQNRRMDPWFNPDVGDSNLITFLNMLQLDGFNPLVLKSVRFFLDDGARVEKHLEKYFSKRDLPKVKEIVQKPVTPGEFVMALEENGIPFSHSIEEMLGCLLSHSQRIQEIDPGEGYWVDHWHYNLDLIESYLALFPEKWRELLVEKNHFSFYDSPVRVRPRSEKMVLNHAHVRQFHAVFHDKEKEQALRGAAKDPYKVKTEYGKGKVYHVNLVVKLVVLLVNKIASLDPSGIGVEMEADRPNWYDALNGLPGLFGSSVSETYELLRLIRFLQSAISKSGFTSAYPAHFPEEFHAFFEAVEKELGSKEFVYWDKTASAKEEYREKIRWGISGKEKNILIGRLDDFLEKAEKKVMRGLARARNQGLPISYYTHDVSEHEPIETNGKKKLNEKGMTCVRPKKFKARPLPLFLEGIVHALRCETDPKKARSLYEAVRRSPLYDRHLGMVKVNAPIQNETLELGRARIFTPGWLENASIFMHMEFKYLLELLRAGLVDEFYSDLKKALPVFMDPAVYGRSILENSTFIASSANPDPRLHGRGFVARMTGTNAEWLQIWSWLTVGKNPFRLSPKGMLEFAPQPILPSWLFDEKNKTFSFRFLGKIDFTYRNPSRKNTYGKGAPQVKKWVYKDSKGKAITVEGPVVSSLLAEKIRRREIPEITLELN